jgi:hypothetical protein
MSANLTVYSMAAAAEAPYRMREAERAYQAAMAGTTAGSSRTTLVGRLASAINGMRRRELAEAGANRSEIGRITAAPLPS